jgi:hypothetical protein
MSRSLTYVLIVSLLTSCVIEDENTPAPSEVFVKYYGSTGENRIADMLVNSEGNIVIYGTSQEVGATQNLYLIELDSLGNVIQDVNASSAQGYNEREFFYDVGTELDSASETQDQATGIREVDNGYLITGNVSEQTTGALTNAFWGFIPDDFSSSRFYRITAPTNSQLFNLNINLGVGGIAPFFSFNGVVSNDIIPTLDGNVLLVGGTTGQEANDQNSNPRMQYFLTKQNFNTGEIIWRRSHGQNSSDDIALTGFQLPNGEFGVLGITEKSGANGNLGINVSIMTFNNLATSQIIDRAFGLAPEGNINAIDIPLGVKEGNFDFLIAGTTIFAGGNARPFVMKVLKNGLLDFATVINSGLDQSYDMTGHDVTITADGDLMVTGSYRRFQDQVIGIKNSEVMVKLTSGSGFPRFLPGNNGESGLPVENNFGLRDGNDVGKVAETLPDGSILIGSEMAFRNNTVMISFMNLHAQAQLKSN